MKSLTVEEAIPGLEHLAPREALRRLQAEAQLTPQQAQRYLIELREERMAAENMRRVTRAA